MFTTNEIKEYLIGKRLMFHNGKNYVEVSDSNNSLNNAIIELEDYENGIEAVTLRQIELRQKWKARKK
jgi:hypothetical protein